MDTTEPAALTRPLIAAAIVLVVDRSADRRSPGLSKLAICGGLTPNDRLVEPRNRCARRPAGAVCRPICLGRRRASRASAFRRRTLICPATCVTIVDLAKLQAQTFGTRRAAVTGALPDIEIAAPSLIWRRAKSARVVAWRMTAEGRSTSQQRARGRDFAQAGDGRVPMRLRRERRASVERSFAMPLKAGGSATPRSSRGSPPRRQRRPPYIDKSRSYNEVLADRAKAGRR